MRNNGRKYSLDYSHMDKSHREERYISAESWRPQPSTHDQLMKIQSERRDRFKAVFLSRQNEAVNSYESENNYSFGNPELPSYKHKHEIQDAIINNQVTIIVGETGSGKSTQAPQFAKEVMGDRPITITQPRILAANGVAERIQEEFSMFGGMSEYEASQMVGIHTSELNTTIGKDSPVRVVTDGLRLAQEYGERDDDVDEVLFIDELHEWNANEEILAATMKKMLTKHPNLRLVVMSATVNADKISNYFADAVGDIPPIIEIEGRTFPVEKIERPNSTVVNEVMGSINEDGDVLVFVPGKREIKDTIDELNRRLSGTPHKNAVLLPLHSKMPKKEQDLVYMQPEDRKKIVVATGIAQTSITIPGITTVVDAGLERRVEFNDEDEPGLELHPTAQDTCTQRAGRAGRVEPGRYILTRLDEENEFKTFISRDKESVAEILRTDLARNVLRTACAGQDFTDLDLYHPVKMDRIRKAKDTLHTLGALEVSEDEDDAVTPIGYHMNKFPLRVTLARMMTEATGKSENVRRYMAAIASSVEAGNLQNFDKGSEKEWKQLIDGENSSDLLAQLRIFSEIHNYGFTSHDENDLAFGEFIDEFDLDAKHVHRALNQYRKNVKHAEVPSELAFSKFDPPTTAELDEIYQCIYSGMADLVFHKVGREGFKPIYEQTGSESRTQRFISDRSVVDKPGDWVVGYGYRHQVYKDGQRVSRDIIEGVTKVVSPVDLASSALKRLVREVPVGYKWRDGQLKEVNELKLYGQSLGLSEEKTPEFNKEVESEVLREVLAHSNRLDTVSKLFDLKKMTESLASKDRLQSIRPLSQEDIVEIIRTVIRKNEISTVWEVENYLMVYDNIENKFSLNQAVDEEDIERINQESPDSIEINGDAVMLRYVDGQPIAKIDSTEIQRAIYLEDGREVKFEVKGKGGKRKSGRGAPKLISGSKLNLD